MPGRAGGLPARPGMTAATEIRTVEPNCARDECGRLRPAERHAASIRPEQSNPPGPDAPQM